MTASHGQPTFGRRILPAFARRTGALRAPSTAAGRAPARGSSGSAFSKAQRRLHADHISLRQRRLVSALKPRVVPDFQGYGWEPLLFTQRSPRSPDLEMTKDGSVVGRLVFSSDRGRSAGAGPTGREWILERSGTLGPFITARRRGRRSPELTVRPDGWGGATIRTAAGLKLTWAAGRNRGTSRILTAPEGPPLVRFEIDSTGATLSGAIGVRDSDGIVRRIPALLPLGLFLAVVEWVDSPDVGVRR